MLNERSSILAIIEMFGILSITRPKKHDSLGRKSISKKITCTICINQ